MARRKAREQGSEVPAGGRAAGGGEVDLDPNWIARVRGGLLDWYRQGHRELPWRENRDPYRILVSELMLVQTTVAAVVPYFGRFLERFPTVEALAAADEAEVLKAWEGLGYYRRARHLHAAARQIVADHGGRIPDDLDALRALPGVGRYVAGAIMSFAFDRPEPIVEANTQRVLARWLAWPEELGTSRSQARLWEASARLVPAVDAGEFNQAFMELGATVCTPVAPRCLICPVRSECRAASLGLQEQLPRKTARPAPLEVVEACALVVDPAGRLLMVQRPAEGLWSGFWELPTVHVEGADPAGRLEALGAVALGRGVERLTGIKVEVSDELTTVRYGVTKHRVSLSVWSAGVRSRKEPQPGGGMVAAAWVDPGSVGETLIVGRPTRSILAWMARSGGSRP